MLLGSAEQEDTAQRCREGAERAYLCWADPGGRAGGEERGWLLSLGLGGRWAAGHSGHSHQHANSVQWNPMDTQVRVSFIECQGWHPDVQQWYKRRVDLCRK